MHVASERALPCRGPQDAHRGPALATRGAAVVAHRIDWSGLEIVRVFLAASSSGDGEQTLGVPRVAHIVVDPVRSATGPDLGERTEVFVIRLHALDRAVVGIDRDRAVDV